MTEECPFCESTRDMIPNPWGSKMICDKPACTFLRTLQRLRKTANSHRQPLLCPRRASCRQPRP